MKATGRIQVGAPTAARVSTVSLGVGTTGRTVFSTGDSTLTTAIAAGSTNTAVVVAQGAGFITGDKIILGYGTDREEEVTLGSNSEAAGTTVSLTATSFVALYSHPVGDRVVKKTNSAGVNYLRPIVPGTIACLNGATAATGESDNFAGTIVCTGGFGSVTYSAVVDYSIGSIVLTTSAAVTSGTISASFDTFTDTVGTDEPSGTGFFKSMNSGLVSRRDIADFMIAQNLGDKDIIFMVEKSANDGRTFTTKGISTCGARLLSLCRASLNLPGGSAGGLDAVRLRVATPTSPTHSSGVSDTAAHASTIKRGVLEVDFVNLTNNG